MSEKMGESSEVFSSLRDMFIPYSHIYKHTLSTI